MERLRELGKLIVERASWLAPMVVAAICTWMTARALYEQSFAIFGRDQGIFQYVAWALRNGERAYVDVRDINGPLPHLWHMVMQALGGEDEHTFRTIDTWMLVLAYGLGIATMPRWIDLEVKPRGLVFWALAGIGVLGAQYVRYDWWHTAQRESLYAVLIFASVALQSIAHKTKSRRRALGCFAAGAALTTLTWFGKPPCVVFAALQACVFILDRRSFHIPFRHAMAACAAGAAIVCAAMLAFVASYGDVVQGIMVLSDVPKLHHTIWNESIGRIYTLYGNRPRLDWALATILGYFVAYRFLKLKRRSLLALVLPIGGALLFFGQGKAFPYHMHMLTLGTAIVQLVILAALVRNAPARDPLFGWVVILAAFLLGYKSHNDARLSQAMKSDWSTIGATAEMRTAPEYFDRFPWDDFGALDLRNAAAFVASKTKPTDRVQMYALDPYFLFLAKRKSATPIIYNFELNVDAALQGGTGTKPSPEIKKWLLAHRDAAEFDVLDRVKANPPAAFVLVDKSPFTHAPNAEKDFAEHCPTLSDFLHERYVEADRFGVVGVWLRKDLEAPAKSEDADPKPTEPPPADPPDTDPSPSDASPTDAPATD